MGSCWRLSIVKQLFGDDVATETVHVLISIFLNCRSKDFVCRLMGRVKATLTVATRAELKVKSQLSVAEPPTVWEEANAKLQEMLHSHETANEMLPIHIAP
mmetsp:Transcript_25695/g.42764  ORF Transcript_25695/g.42764 Transcript_25695/m.42764 type:complete len:101 (-) Transcript_25695:7-309(-)